MSWITGDFLLLEATVIDPHRQGFDLIATNPPYKHAEDFFFKALDYIKPNARIVFLLRLGFLASERRYKMMWTAGYAPTCVTILNTRPSFTGDGLTYPGDFAMFEWEFEDGVCQEDNRLEYMVYSREVIKENSRKRGQQ